MAAITSLGIGSGVDINSMVSQLVALERRPLEQMRSAATKLQTQVSSYGKIQSLFSSLQSASNALNAASLWQRSTASSSDASAVATVGGGSASPGNYAVTVQRLALSQSLVSGTVFGAATELVGDGTLSISLGSWNDPPTTLTPKPNALPVDVLVSSTDTLQTLRDKINAAGAGVNAAIVTDANGVRLSLRSSSTGAENGFRITSSNNDVNAGLGRLSYNPAAGAPPMALRQSAVNALATVNGIAIVSAANELSGVIEGLTLRLRKETATAVDIDVSSDREAVSAAVKTFAEAYNQLAKYIAEQVRYDPASKVGGPLQGDSSATALQSRMRSVLNATSGASEIFRRPSDVGLELQREGTLSVNQGKLDSATGNLVELKKAFANLDLATPANNGFARRYADMATQLLGVDGNLSTRTDSLRKRITKNGVDQERLNDRVERFQQRLVQQYTAMDSNLSRLNGLSSYVTQQLAQMNKTSY